MSKVRDRIPVCKHSKREDLSPDLCVLIDKIEGALGYDLTFSSGLRCPACNAKVGGVPNSAHLHGKAVDVIAGDSVSRFHLVSLALEFNVVRIGIARRFIHLDVDKNLPGHVLWLY